ncbi:MAG: hypothetical protein R3E12_03215 [Candidatus Eisenbacteria bacterium]
MKLQSSFFTAALLAVAVHPAFAWAGAPESEPGVSRITPETAIASAVNALKVVPGGVALENPSHRVRFDGAGVQVHPRRGPDWEWQFVRASQESGPVAEGLVAPELTGPLEVQYERGFLTERYDARARTVEQQFIIEEPLASAGDLVIEGAVLCDGVLERSDRGWTWRNDEGVVTIADVHVFDANGRTVPAAMSIESSRTRIVVDGRGLADATYPVTVDPEIGTNDFRISDMGTDGDLTYDGQSCAVAYDATDNQYLVVWEGDDDTGGLIDGEFEIFGQRIDAVTGAAVGANDFRISDMGVNGDGTADAVSPAVAWNSSSNEYLVVWSGDDGTGTMVDGEFEIFGQRIAGASGLEVGVNDFRISDMGPEGDALFDAETPAVAYDATRNEYLVVWSGDDVVDEEFEIHGQRLTAAGASIGVNDFRISDMGLDGDPLFDAITPQVVSAASLGEYLVVWSADDISGILVNGEFEVWGQRISAATGSEVGVNDFRISDMGPDGNDTYDAQDPAVAWSPAENRYLVVWSGDDNLGGVVEGEREIFGQLLDGPTGTEVGTNDFRISDMGPNGDPLFDALDPAAAYNPNTHEFLVVWDGDDQGGGLDDGEFEIFGQRLSASTGTQVGANDFVMSDTGTPGSIDVGAFRPRVAVRDNGTFDYQVVWHADTDLGGLVDEEFEIYGQRLRSDGVQIGADDFRVSDMGPDGDVDWDARQPAIAYNPDANEYLVVWEGDDNTGTLVDGETEIFGQRIDATNGSEVGTNDFRISDMGPDGDPAWDAQKPAVTYDPVTREYLVVWSGEDNLAGLVQGEFEIYGQRLSGTTGAEVGLNDFRISDMGPDGALCRSVQSRRSRSTARAASTWSWEAARLGWRAGGGRVRNLRAATPFPTACRSGPTTSDQRYGTRRGHRLRGRPAVLEFRDQSYLVVFGEDNAGLRSRRVRDLRTAAGCQRAQVGANDFRISTAGNDGDDTYDAFNPAVAYNSLANEFLVVWDGEDIGGLLAPGEKEIFGQRLSAGGLQVGIDDFRISDMGPDGNSAYDGNSGRYLQPIGR